MKCLFFNYETGIVRSIHFVCTHTNYILYSNNYILCKIFSFLISSVIISCVYFIRVFKQKYHKIVVFEGVRQGEDCAGVVRGSLGGGGYKTSDPTATAMPAASS